MIKKRIGEALVDAGLISARQLKEALKDQQALGGRIGGILFDKGMITAKDYLLALSSHLGIPAIDFSKITIPEKTLKLLNKDFCWEHMVLPVRVLKTDNGYRLLLAMADPKDAAAIEKVQTYTALVVRPALAMENEIRQVLLDYYDNQAGHGDYRYESSGSPHSNYAVQKLAYEADNRKVGEPEQPHIFIGSNEKAEGGMDESENSSPWEGKGDHLFDELMNTKLVLRALLVLLSEKGVISRKDFENTLAKLKIERGKSF